MSAIVIDRTPTNRFLGICTPCNRPVAVEIEATGRTISEGCAECSQPVTLERLVAVTTMDVCDPSCMGATGPNCSCGCGGANHGGAYVRSIHTHHEVEKAVKKHRATSAKRAEAAKKAAATRAAKKATEKRERIDGWFASLEPAEKAAVEWLTADDGDSLTGFLWDMRYYVIRFRDGQCKYDNALTERQLAAVVKCHTREVEWAARNAQREAERAAEAATAKPVPLGKALVIEGEIVHTKTDTAYYGGREKVTYKMMVKGADGWKVWTTIPQVLLDAMLEAGNSSADLKGRTVRFIANIELGKDKDPIFGIGTFPRKAELINA